MRGHPQRAMAFFTESFIDELAHAAGLEPLAFRMAMLGGNPRLARCLQAAARRAAGTAAARAAPWASPLLGLRLAHRAARRRDHRRRPVDRGAPAGRRGRLRPDRQSRAGPAADRRRADLGASAWRPASAPDWAAGCRARARSAPSACRASATRPTSASSSSPAAAAPGGVSGLGAPPLAPAVANAIYAGDRQRGCATCRSTLWRRHDAARPTIPQIAAAHRRAADQSRHARRARRAAVRAISPNSSATRA